MSSSATTARVLRVAWWMLGAAALLCVSFLAVSFLPAARDAMPALFARGQSTVALQAASALGILFYGILRLNRVRLEAAATRLEATILASGGDGAARFDPRDASRLGGVLFASASLSAGLLLLLAVFEPHRYFFLLREDGPVEYASALLWLLAMIFILLALQAMRPRARLTVVLYLGLALFFLVCGGEEISWGQRILGRESGEFFSKVNKQNETNLHNIGSISIFSNLFFALSLFVFVFLPWLSRRFGTWRRWLLFERAPHISRWAEGVYLTGLTLFVLVGLRFQTLGFSPWTRQGWYNQMDDEIFELFAALSYCVFALLDFAWRRRNRAIMATEQT